MQISCQAFLKDKWKGVDFLDLDRFSNRLAHNTMGTKGQKKFTKHISLISSKQSLFLYICFDGVGRNIRSDLIECIEYDILNWNNGKRLLCFEITQGHQSPCPDIIIPNLMRNKPTAPSIPSWNPWREKKHSSGSTYLQHFLKSNFTAQLLHAFDNWVCKYTSFKGIFFVAETTLRPLYTQWGN